MSDIVLSEKHNCKNCRSGMEGQCLVNAFILNDCYASSYKFVCSYFEEYDAYSLTFLEAIILAKEGGKVSNNQYPNSIYKYQDGTLTDDNGWVPLKGEQKAKWKKVIG